MATAAHATRRFPRLRYAPAVGWKAWALEHVWIVPVVLVALWLRATGLSAQFLYGDEAEYASVARGLSRDWGFLAYPKLEGYWPGPFVSQPPLLLYLMAISMRVFGATDLAALLPSVILGTATVLAVYGLGRRLGGRFTGLTAAIVLAVLPFHIEMSRKAMLDVGYAFFLVLTAYFLVAWLQTRSRRHAVGVGCAVAATALSKLPGMLAGPVVLAIFLLALVVTLVRAWRGRAAKGEVKETLLQSGLGAIPIAVGAGLYLMLLAHLTAVQNLWIKLQWQLGRVDADYAQVREVTAVARPPEWYFTDPNFGLHALLGGAVVTLAVLGLVAGSVRLLASRGARLEHLVVPVTIVVFLGFFAYSERKEGFYLLPLAPFAAILVAQAADGLRRLLAWGGLRVRPVAPRATVVALAGALLLVASPTYDAATESYQDFYLGDTQQKYFGYGTREAAAWIHERDPTAGQYGTLLGRFTLYWYNEQPTYHWYVDHTYLEGKIQEGKLTYVVYDDYLGLAFDRDYMRQLIDRYGGQSVVTFRDGWGEVTVFELNPSPE